ncbi:MAG: hypothetical protein ABGW95_00045, partial [Candidatus Poseidoniia archaeon]
MHGPANRIPMFARQEPDSGADSSSGEEGSGGGEQPPADTDAQLAPAPELNEDETAIGMDEQSCPKPLRLFEAWHATMGRLSAEAAKFAQAQVQQGSSDGAPVAARRAAAEELVRSSVAVDMIDVAKQMGKSSGGRAELERMAAAQSEDEQLEPMQALAVPSGKALSIFDPSALPAAYTEFLFGDCVPFLKRETPVTCQQIFAALPAREELEYSLPHDEEPFRASGRSRFDSPEFYALFASFLRTLKLFQSCKASMSREGFDKDFRIIASATSKDFVDAALHESQPR